MCYQWLSFSVCRLHSNRPCQSDTMQMDSFSILCHFSYGWLPEDDKQLHIIINYYINCNLLWSNHYY